jgi:hypothetical protein
MRRVTVKHYFAVVPMVFAMACGASSEQLVRRASFDLDCAPERIRVHEIDRRTRGVQGCGKRAVYLHSCQHGTSAHECTWVLNSDASRTAAAPSTDPHPIIRTGLDSHRGAILQCTGGPVDVVAAFDASGHVSFSLAGPLAGTDAERCVRAGLGRVTVPAPGQPGAVTHRIQ